MNTALSVLLHPVAKGIGMLFFRTRKKTRPVRMTPKFTVTVLLRLPSEAGDTASDLSNTNQPLSVNTPKL